jgi:hypothetical protein
MFKHRKLGSV